MTSSSSACDIGEAIRARVAAEEREYGTGQKNEDGLAEEACLPFPRLEDWRADVAFAGPAPRRVYIVEGVFPAGQPSLVASSGGLGKSLSTLALAVDVASEIPGRHFGGVVSRFGTVVYVTAEDDLVEVHVRLEALGGKPHNLIVVPLPSAGGTRPLFKPDSKGRGPVATEAWESFKAQVLALPDLALIVLDPLQALCTLDLNMPENAQFVCSHVAGLASRSGAAVVVTHHFAKREASTPEEARAAIRGTAGLVDGVRAAYALWVPAEVEGKSSKSSPARICKALGEPYESGKVVLGAVVKCNGRGNRNITTFVRDARGVLIDRTSELRRTGSDHTSDDFLGTLQEAVAEAARQGRPYTKSGANGVYDRRHELPEPLNLLGRDRAYALIDELLAAKRLVQAMAQGAKTVKWLDVPDGPFARGEGCFAPGHVAPKEPEAGGENEYHEF